MLIRKIPVLVAMGASALLGACDAVPPPSVSPTPSTALVLATTSTTVASSSSTTSAAPSTTTTTTTAAPTTTTTAAPTTTAPAAATVQYRSTTINGRTVRWMERSSRLGGSRPIVIGLHGVLNTGYNLQASAFGFGTAVLERDAVVVLPDGLNQWWNAGICCGSSADDVGFLNTVIDQAHALEGMGSAKVYLVGFSNGGFLANLYMSTPNASKIAGVATIASPNLGSVPNRAVPWVMVHGTADPTIPYTGGWGLASLVTGGTSWPDANAANASLATSAGCAEQARTSGPSGSIRSWTCAGGVPMRFYTLNNFAHDLPATIDGRPSFDTLFSVWGS